MSGKQKKRGISPATRRAETIHDSVKKAEPEALEKLLFRDIGYVKSDFNQQKISRMRGFSEKLCGALELDSLEQLHQLDPVLRRAALELTEYGPPLGARIWVSVRADFFGLGMSIFAVCSG